MSEQFHQLTRYFNAEINRQNDVHVQATLNAHDAKNRQDIERQRADILSISSKNIMAGAKARNDLEHKIAHDKHIAFLTANFRGKLMVEAKDAECLDVASDHNMTVRQWIEINYPDLEVVAA